MQWPKNYDVDPIENQGLELDLGQSNPWFLQFYINLQLLNPNWGSNLKEEQFLGHLILEYIWNSEVVQGK